MLFVLLFLVWLIAPLVELGIIIALCIRLEEYKKEIANLSRQKDSAVLKEALTRAKERAEEWPAPQEACAPEEEMQSFPKEEPEQEPAVLEPPLLERPIQHEPVRKDGTMATGAMIIGVVLVVLAGLVFATTTWRILPSICKVVLVLLFSGMFFGASFLAENKLHLHRTGNGFYVLGCMFVFLSVLAAAYFQLLGPAFILQGTNRWWVLWLGSLLTVFMLFLGMKRFCDPIYTQACFWGMTVSMSFLMMACQVSWDEFLCGMTIYASLLAAGDWVLKKRELNLKEESVRKLLADNFETFSMVHFWVFAILMMAYEVFTGLYGVGSLSGGLGILAMAFLIMGTVFQARKMKWNGGKVFFSLAVAGAIHSLAAWGYVNLNSEGRGILDAFFSDWDVILMILAAQIGVLACFLAGKKKRIWLHTVYGDGIKIGVLAYDWLLLAGNAVWGESPQWQIGALAGAAVLAVAVAVWGKEVPFIKMALPFLFWYMLFPLRSLIGVENQIVSSWIDRGGLEFVLLAGLALWDHRKKSGFHIPVCIIGTMAQIAYFSGTQVCFPFLFLLSASILGQGLAYSYEAASLCSMAGVYLLAYPLLENGVFRGLFVLGTYGIGMAVQRKKTLFWDICGCVLVIGLMAEFYMDQNLKIWNLLLCLAVFVIFYIRFYMGNRMWPHLLITLAVLPVPLVLTLRYHWSEDLLYMVIGGMYLLTGMVSRYFSFIIHQDGQVSGGWRVDWYHVLGIVVLVSMMVGASTDERWRFGYLLLLSLYFLQYGKVKPWRRPAWAGAAAMLVLAFWSQPFVEWPMVLETEIALLPAAFYIWFLGRLFPNGKDPQKTILQTGGYVLCLLVLCVDAWMTKNVIDALVLEGLCLLVFLWAQVVKCRRWVRISGGLMVVLALYMTKDFWLNISWWVYLLAAGIGLILFAAIKEKKR